MVFQFRIIPVQEKSDGNYFQNLQNTILVPDFFKSVLFKLVQLFSSHLIYSVSIYFDIRLLISKFDPDKKDFKSKVDFKVFC